MTFLVTNNKSDDRVIFSQEELSRYNGIIHERLYLAVLGHVFDVTDGDKHYKPGSSYNYFIGKDGSRALVTGNFKDESHLKDHVIDLPCNDLLTLVNWQQTYRKKYKFLGLLEGRFYDTQGEETKYLKKVKSKLKDCREDEINAEKENQKYPPCNAMWNEDETSRVWCTKSSGGITRDWVGVPRLLFTPGEEYPRCVCVNLGNENSSTNLLKLYDNCPQSSTSCPPIENQT
ncbi:unnamed protein product, partial [Iphiclides podalirius]